MDWVNVDVWRKATEIHYSDTAVVQLGENDLLAQKDCDNLCMTKKDLPELKIFSPKTITSFGLTGSRGGSGRGL